MSEEFAAAVAGIGALAEPVRRGLYAYVVAQPEAVSRDQAAAAAGVPRHTAKFHLDRLVEEGLLEAEFRRLSERRGPGAGRPTKLYRRSARDVAVSLPERRYDLAGEILARAVSDAGGPRPELLDAVRESAEAAGRQMAAEAGADDVAAVLARHGYEPRVEDGRVVLANCPFHALAQAHTELVCGMNLALIQALVDESDAVGVTASLDPAPGRCCVTLDRAV